MSDSGIPDLSELYGEFVSENKEILENLARELVSLENSPDDPDIINKLFRFAHTLKGNAGFIGVASLSDIAHRMENVLDKLRDGEIIFFHEINDVFFKAIDTATLLLEDFIEGKQDERDISGIAGDIDGLLESPSEGAGVIVEKEKVERSEEEASPVSKTEEGGRESKETSSMRVNTVRLDSMVNLVGELATGRSRLMQISNELKNEDLKDIASYINNISSQLQDEVLSIRMVPVKELFNRFFRLVRDTSRSLGKDVRLAVEGEKTELDKRVIELLYDPLVHLVRNSIGHGIEEKDERAGLGKDKTATVTMNAYHEHNSIYIQVKDDGRGLDIDEIKRKAIERGIVSAEDAESVSDEEAGRFIFSTGFSTAKGVDAVSGRGVGMDVVRTNIEKIGGDVALDWEEGMGTTVTVRVPLTLAIVHLFLVRCGRQIFGIPLPYMDETIMISDKDIEFIKGQMVYMLRHNAVPILTMEDIFDLDAVAVKGDDADKKNIVILEQMNMKAGIVVDEFMGKVETVIKPLGPFIDRLSDSAEGISGASILGTGDIVLVMDIPAIWKML